MWNLVDSTFPTAKRLVPELLDACPVKTVRACFQKSWHLIGVIPIQLFEAYNLIYFMMSLGILDNPEWLGLIAAHNGGDLLVSAEAASITISPTPDPKEREEGSVGFKRVRHPPIQFQSWELWEYLFFNCTVITPFVPSFPCVHHSIHPLHMPLPRANFVSTVRSGEGNQPAPSVT